MDTLQDRLSRFLSTYGITMQYFEQQCNIAQGLGKRLSEKSYATTFKRISEGFPQLNIAWLKTGRGDMINTSPHINMSRYDSPGDNDVFGDIKKPIMTIPVDGSTADSGDMGYIKILLKEKDERINDLKKQLELAEKRIEEKDERIGELKQEISELKRSQL